MLDRIEVVPRSRYLSHFPRRATTAGRCGIGATRARGRGGAGLELVVRVGGLRGRVVERGRRTCDARGGTLSWRGGSHGCAKLQQHAGQAGVRTGVSRRTERGCGREGRAQSLHAPRSLDWPALAHTSRPCEASRRALARGETSRVGPSPGPLERGLLARFGLDSALCWLSGRKELRGSSAQRVETSRCCLLVPRSPSGPPRLALFPNSSLGQLAFSSFDYPAERVKVCL